MKEHDSLFWLLTAIALGTVATGLTQMVMPEIVLRVIGADETGASSYFFGIIGMFMLLFGALMLHALWDDRDHPIAVLWASMQKLFASVAVLLGVQSRVFAPLALAVAGFDLISGVLMLVYWSRIRRAEAHA